MTMHCRERLAGGRLIAIFLLLLVGGCASLPTGYERVASDALNDTASTLLGRSASELLNAHLGQSGFRPLPNGVDALVVRMLLAESAERSLDVQYYLWHGDLTGRLFANALLRAADRGVRVRILIDDVGTKANDEILLTLDSHPNIEIRLFNPVASRAFRGLGMLSDFARVNRRMHNKSFVADNQRAVLGGRNIGDEYFDANGGVVFSDLDVETVGPVVAEVSKAFDIYWNAPMSIPIAALTGRSGKAVSLDALRADLAAFVEAQRESPYVAGVRSTLAQRPVGRHDDLFWGRCLLVVDDPDKVSREPHDREGHLLPQLGIVTAQMRNELLIVSPYFVPGNAGIAWLRGLSARGIRVTVLTNSLAATDVGAVHSGYQRYRKALLDAGVRLHEFKPGAITYGRAKGNNRQLGGSSAALHAKTFVFDRRAVFIGSLNLDPRSTQLNTEIGVVCESEPFAHALADGVLDALDRVAWRVEKTVGPGRATPLVWIETTPAGVVEHRQEPGVSVWRKLGVFFLGLLPSESQF